MIHLIVGNTGSGKTTYSKELKKKDKGIIFTIDKWNNALFLSDKKPNDGLEWFLERINRAESVIMDLIEQLENAKTESILDLGLSKFEHREKFRNFAEQKGFQLKTHFLEISKETRLKRIMERNKAKGETFEFEVSLEDFNFMENWFEKPDQIELKDGLRITE